MSGVLLGPGEGERHATGPSSELVIKVGGDVTGGTFFLGENTVPAGFPGPPLHRHKQLCDMFYVLEGTLTVHIEDETHLAPPGTFVCAPPGVAHTFSNPSDTPVRFLNFSTPAGWENYMRDLAAAAAQGPLTSESIAAVASQHDFELA